MTEINLIPHSTIVVGEYILGDLGAAIKRLKPKAKIAVITDTNVAKLYLDIALDSITMQGYEVIHMVMPAGEEYKNTSTYLQIVDFLAENKLTRHDLVVALGGGVVSDIAGFAASTYLRGIDFAIVSTSFLGAIDASVGGKTAVNISAGKNLLGAFHQPILVYIDTKVFGTLSREDYTNGLGEGIKYAVLCGGVILDILESGLCEQNILEFTLKAIEYKATIVSGDTFEKGERMLLNLGHTFGHAIEKLSDYHVPHGLAVLKGLKIIMDISLGKGMLSRVDYDRLISLMDKYDIDYTTEYCMRDMSSIVSMDKKRSSAKTISVVLIGGIANPQICSIDLDDEIFVK